MARKPRPAEAALLARLADLPDDVIDQAADQIGVLLDQHKVVELEPHLVRGQIEILTDLEGGGRRMVGSLDCPDCTVGLAAMAPDIMACQRIPASRRPEFSDGAKPGDVLACGLKGVRRG